MRQTKAAATITPLNTLRELLQLHCRRCSATLRSLSHFFLLLPTFGQLQVSCMPLHSFRPSFRSITPVRSQAPCFRSYHPTPGTQLLIQAGCHALRKPTLQYSPGSIMLHYVLHSFQSHTGHPLPSVLVLALRPPAAFRGTLAQTYVHKADALCHT